MEGNWPVISGGATVRINGSHDPSRVEVAVVEVVSEVSCEKWDEPDRSTFVLGRGDVEYLRGGA